MPEQKILILELGGIGDTAMSLPAVKAVLNSYKNADITILTVPRTRAIIESLKSASYKNLNVLSTDAMDKKGINGWLSLITEMRGEGYDLAIDLSAVETFKSAVKRWLFFKSLGVKKTFGRDTNRRGWGFAARSEDTLTSDEHEVIRKIKVVELLGLKADRVAPKLIIPESELKHADDLLAGLADKGPLIGINPGAFRPSRMWSARGFEQIARWLIEEMSASIVITGGDKEKSLVERIARSLPEENVRTVIGASIIRFAAFISKMNLFITNDTGPMHIAAAVDVPIIAIFGQTNLKRYHPYMDDSRFVCIKMDHSVCPYFSFEHPRQECRRYDCNGKNCMDAITVTEVKEAVKKLMSTQSRRVLVQL